MVRIQWGSKGVSRDMHPPNDGHGMTALLFREEVLRGQSGFLGFLGL
jgi:hypothetical protein